MIPNGQWMRSAPNENPVVSQAFQRGASYPIWTIVTVVNYVRETGSLTKNTLGYAAMPAPYFFVYLYSSLKDATNLALDSMLALDAPPLRWICPIKAKKPKKKLTIKVDKESPDEEIESKKETMNIFCSLDFAKGSQQIKSLD